MSAAATVALMLLHWDAVPAGSSLLEAVSQVNARLARLKQPASLYDFKTVSAKGAVPQPVAGGSYTIEGFLCALLPRSGLTFQWFPGHALYIYRETDTDTLANACTAVDWLKATPAEIHPPVWACGCKADRIDARGENGS